MYATRRITSHNGAEMNRLSLRIPHGPVHDPAPGPASLLCSGYVVDIQLVHSSSLASVVADLQAERALELACGRLLQSQNVEDTRRPPGVFHTRMRSISHHCTFAMEFGWLETAMIP